MKKNAWQFYWLQHKQFVLKTDHRSLLFLTEQRATTKLQQKAMLKLMDLDYKIQYKQGFANMAADSEPNQSVIAISVSQPNWLQILQEGYLEDDDAKAKLTELSLVSPNDKGFFPLGWHYQIQQKSIGWPQYSCSKTYHPSNA